MPSQIFEDVLNAASKETDELVRKYAEIRIAANKIGKRRLRSMVKNQKKYRAFFDMRREVKKNWQYYLSENN